jgi:hypothetical protein
MNYIKHLKGFFDRLEADANMTAHHISLYMVIFNVWNMNRFLEQFEVTRMDLMSMSRIGSAHTYSRCMKQLDDWGYIKYSANSNRYRVSKVSCVRFDTANNTTNDTATDTASDTTNGIASSTLFINSSNNTKDKQSHPKIFKNGRENKPNRSNPLHVNIDKDYSEPL